VANTDETDDDLEVTDTGKFKIRNTVGTAPIYPSGFGVAGHKEGVMISFFFNPPEEKDALFIVSRIALSFTTAERLSKTLKEATDEMRKKIKEGKKPDEPAK
jgi:hypothetical protein